MSRSRKHDVFTVSGDVVVMPTKVKLVEREGITIVVAHDSVSANEDCSEKTTYD